MKKILFTLCTFLLPALLLAQEKPTYIIHPHEELPQLQDADYRTIFLAGTIDMGNSINWQEQVENTLRERGNYIVFNPRQAEWHPERIGEMDYQVNWELEHLEKADIILMNFVDGSQSPITLLELGLFAQSGKLKVICTDKFYRYDNVRITCSRYGVKIYSTIEEALRD